MKFYKIWTEGPLNHDFEYKTGLNVDHIPFNPSGDCEPGGLYYSREDILYFLGYGKYISEVTIPEDAQVYYNGGFRHEFQVFPNKWKADKIILSEPRLITVSLIMNLIEEGANLFLGDNENSILNWSIKNNEIGLAKFLKERGLRFRDCSRYLLAQAASRGKIDFIKLFLEDEKGFSFSDMVSAFLFEAVSYKRIELIRYLITLTALPPSPYSFEYLVGSLDYHSIFVMMYELAKLNPEYSKDDLENFRYMCRF